MAHDGHGTIYIPLAEFWEFVAKYAPATNGAEMVPLVWFTSQQTAVEQDPSESGTARAVTALRGEK